MSSSSFPPPPAVLLGPWLAECLRGRIGPDDMADRIRGDDPRHLVVTPSGVHELRELPGLVRGLTEIRVAVPAAGDPAGLAGPPAFTAAAVEAGCAVILGGLGRGLVPEYDARTVLWRESPAALGPPEDPAEASRQLRRELTEAATELADSGVSGWQPEIPDLLLNADRRPRPPLPPTWKGSRIEIVDRGLLALEIVALAPHHPALGRLARAARRAVAAHCSDNLGAS